MSSPPEPTARQARPVPLGKADLAAVNLCFFVHPLLN